MLTAIPVVLAPPTLTIAQERQMCFHVPSFAFLTFGPAMWLTAQDQPTIGNAATIRMIPAASTTIGLKKISRIRFIFRSLSARRLKDFPFRPPIEVPHR